MKHDDQLWQMISSEMQQLEIDEMRDYLAGNVEHFEMGFGDLQIEPYDSHGGASRMFRLRHERYGETVVARSALLSVLHDLSHDLRR